MRRLMVSPKNLKGAIFIGGMEGVDEEAERFKEAHEHLPRYAIASTGSASMDLFERMERFEQANFAGRLQGPDREMLKTGSSYALIARKILDDMGVRDETERRG